MGNESRHESTDPAAGLELSAGGDGSGGKENFMSQTQIVDVASGEESEQLRPEKPASAGPPGGGRLLSLPVTIGLVGGLVATLFFFWLTVEGSAVPEQPHNVPVAVVGPASAVNRLVSGLERGGDFKGLVVPTETAAATLVQHRNADAIIDLYTHQLQTVPAASTLTPIVLEQVFSSPGSPVSLRVVPLVPLAPGDPNGMGLMLFLPLAAVLGGLPSGLALGLLTKPRRPTSLADSGRRILLIFAASALIALGLALLADWILGYGGTQMLTIWGWTTLLVTACMACAEAFVSAFGVPGFLLAAVPLLFFGIPSGPWPAPWNWQSGLFRILGPFDPVGTMADGVRNTIFFASADPTKDLIVMVLWIAVPVVLMLGLGIGGERHEETAMSLASA